MIQFGANSETDGNGMLVTMPTDKDVMWIRTRSDYWTAFKVYDSSGTQFGSFTTGYRHNNTIAPDGGMEDDYQNYHEWVPVNVKGHDGTLYVISQPNTNGSFYVSGIAFTANPIGIAWQSAVGYNIAINGGNATNWNTADWNNDQLGQINNNTAYTLKVPVVSNGKSKLLYMIMYNSNWNEGGHQSVSVNGTTLSRRLSEGWSNPYQRFKDKNQYNKYTAVYVPESLIPDGAKFIDVVIDTNGTNSHLYFREIGTHDFDLPDFETGIIADTMSDLSCTDGQVAVWNDGASEWQCADQAGTGTNAPEKITNACGVAASCTATCTGGKKTYRGGCLAVGGNNYLNSSYSADETSWTCAWNHAMDTVTAYAYCERL